MERISFTRPSAARIARVVRTVENARPPGAPLTFLSHISQSNGKVFRVCTFTGAWAIGQSNTVTLKYQSDTPNTVNATNLFFPITNTTTTEVRDCAIAKDGTAWYLIDVRMSTATAIFVTGTASGVAVVEVESRNYVSSTATQSVVTDVTLSATLDPSNCSIAVGKSLVTSAIVVASGMSTGLFVTTTATAVFASTTATATYLTFD